MKLSRKQLSGLEDSDFGLPSERKYPLTDRQHVTKAIQFFSYCPSNKKKELAKNINRRAKELGMKMRIRGEFFKYASPDIIQISKEASNVGLIEPIVAQDETKQPIHIPALTDETDDRLKVLGAIIDKKMEKSIVEVSEGISTSFIKFNDEVFRQWVENKCNYHRGFHSAQIVSMAHDSIGTKRPISTFQDFEKMLNHIIYRNEVEDILKYITSSCPKKITVRSDLEECTMNSLSHIREVFFSKDMNDVEKAIQIAMVMMGGSEDRILYLLIALYKMSKTSNSEIFWAVLHQMISTKTGIVSSVLPKKADDSIDSLGKELGLISYGEGFARSRNFSIKDSQQAEIDAHNFIHLNEANIISVMLCRYIKKKFNDKANSASVEFSKRYTYSSDAAAIGERIYSTGKVSGYQVVNCGYSDILTCKIAGRPEIWIVACVQTEKRAIDLAFHIHKQGFLEFFKYVKQNPALCDPAEAFANSADITFINITCFEDHINEAPLLEQKILSTLKGVRIDKNGDISINLRSKLSFDHYNEIHKALMMNKDTNDIEGMKRNIAYLFSLIATLENEYVYNKNIDKTSKQYSEMIKLRALYISDFKFFYRIVLQNDPKFNFLEYYEKSGYSNTVYTIDHNTIKGLGLIFRNAISL